MDESFFTEEELRHLRAVSTEEITELVESLRDAAAGLSDADSRDDAAREMHALFHTITGSAGVAGFNAIVELAAEAESATAEENFPLSADVFPRIQEIIGLIEDLLGGEQFS